MTSRQLAWRTVTAERGRAALAVAGVMVIGALLFDMLLLSRGLIASFRGLLDTSGYDVRVVADSFPIRVALTNVTGLARDLSELPEVEAVAVVRAERAVAAMPNRPLTEVRLVNLSAGAEGRAWRLVSGEGLDSARRPAGESPLVISRQLAERLAIGPGARLPLRVFLEGIPSALPVVSFTVIGTAEFRFDLAGEDAVATTEGAFARARATAAADEADVILVASRPGVEGSAMVAAIEARRPDVRAFSTDQIVARFNETGFTYFRQISFVLSSITLGFAFLLVATILTVSVNQRLGQVAALRALGFRRRRIAAALVWESALLVGTGAICSLPAGWLLARWLDRILRDMPNIPDRVHFFVFEPGVAAVHLGMLAATALAAAIYPVWVATSLPIAASLRSETIS